MTDLFNANDGSSPVADPTDQAPANYVDYATSKFRTADNKLDVEGLAKGKYESDLFIQKLQREQAEMRKELETRLSLEAYLEKTMNSASKAPQAAPDRSNIEGTTLIEASAGNAGLSEAQIAELIRKTLSTETKRSTQTQNIESTKTAMEAAWGQNYSAKLAAKANELGLGKDFLNNLAAESPKAFLSLMEVKPVSQIDNSYSPPVSSVRPGDSKAPIGVKNQTYYAALKKADPKTYWLAKTQAEMHREALRLGDSFFQ